ncbi:MAG: electron transfer flavoprotein subunit alpha/FixB family protein [Ectothiorhodospiraceae bacterium]|jgi:electron transfer flavoprotein alpha subunit
MNDILRRNPRAEWLARNRLHPEHAATTGPTRGPTGLIRRNPHAVGFIGPNGVKRIDRSAAPGGGTGLPVRRRQAAAEPERPLHRVAEPTFLVAVVPEMVGGRLTSHDLDVLGQAQQLAAREDEQGAVVAVIFGEHKDTTLAEAGVDRLLHLPGDAFSGYVPEARLQALLAAESELQPAHWLFPDGPNGTGELGRRFAARLGERPATAAWRVDGENTVSRADSGRQDIHRQTPRLLLLAAECADPVSETRHEVLPLTLQPLSETADNRLVDDGLLDVDPNAVPLEEAEFIFSGGNGVKDWKLFHSTAAALGATEGASRVAVDDGHMPRSRQVGATGRIVTARVYVAVGISGAIQHLQGIGRCDKVVAVNMDPDCDMIKRADLSVIGNSSDIMRALAERMAGQADGEVERDAA